MSIMLETKGLTKKYKHQTGSLTLIHNTKFK